MADLFQYVWATFIWGNFHWRKEKYFQNKNLSDVNWLRTANIDPELSAPRWFNRPSLFLFGIKIVLVVVGYIFIGFYLASILPVIQC